MKKIVQLLSAVALLAGMAAFSSCDKHAFSDSTNKFEYVTDNVPMGHVGEKLTIYQGSTDYLYASSKDHVRITGGDYTVEPSDASIVTAAVSSWGGDKCIALTGKNEGVTSVTLHFLWRGFDLHKSISVTVKPLLNE